jgi:hypothetical protein
MRPELLLNPVLVDSGSWRLLGTHLVHLNPPSYLDGLLPPSGSSPTEGHEPVQVAVIFVYPRAGCTDSPLSIIVLAFASLFLFNALGQPLLASLGLTMRSPSDGLDIFDDLIEKAFWRHMEAFFPNDTPLQAGEAASGP